MSEREKKKIRYEKFERRESVGDTVKKVGEENRREEKERVSARKNRIDKKKVKETIKKGS